VIKAQVQIGGRGKAGGIKVAKDSDEARAHAGSIIGMDIRGPRGEGPFKVHEVWVEVASEIDAEYYASVILDRSAKKPLLMLSRMGGMNVEEIAETDPDALVRLHVMPSAGLSIDDARRLAVDAQIEMEVLVHSFASAESSPFAAKSRDGLAQAREALDAGQAALDELRFRRRGLAVSSFFILLVLIGLGLKIRAMSADANPPE